MHLNQTIVEQDGLEKLVGNRATLDPATDKRFIDDKIFNAPLLLEIRENRNPGVYITELRFRNCVFKKQVSIGDWNAAGMVDFQDCTFEDKVTFAAPDNIGLIGNTHFKSDLSINTGNKREFSISNLSVAGTLEVRSNIDVKLTIENINVGQKLENQILEINASSTNLNVNNVHCIDFHINRVALKYGTNIFSNVHGGRLFLKGPWSDATIHFENSHFQNLILENISNNNNQVAISDECKIGILSIALSDISKIDISNSQIDYLIFTQTNPLENIINIEKVKINNQFRFENVYNKGLIFLRELSMELNSQFGIFSSNLGKTDFVNCDFSKAVFEFENSKVTEVFLSDTEFPLTTRLKGIPNPSQAQLAFGQLATAYSKQGDTVKALEYQAREIEAHYGGLKLWSKDFFKALNLGLNKWSNNFGRNWQRGVIFSIASGLLFFYFLVISSKEYTFGIAFEINEKLVSGFLKFMNPLRFLDTESLFRFGEGRPLLTLNGWSYVWDFLGRLIVAYGYYQTIQAFRRFGRK